jgi:hypothetical protein
VPRDEDLPMSAPAKSAAVRPTTRDLGPGLRRARRIQAKRASAQLVEAGGDARVRAAKKVARKRDLSTYLSMYFRDMSALDVLRPESRVRRRARDRAARGARCGTELLSLPWPPSREVLLVEQRAPGLAELRDVQRLGDQLARGLARLARAWRARRHRVLAPALRDADRRASCTLDVALCAGRVSAAAS